MRQALERSLDETDQVLSKQNGGPFFLGEQLSLVDCVFASSLERIAASMLYYKGLKVKGSPERWPAINGWFEAMEQRASYRASMSDFHTNAHDLPPQIGGCIANRTQEQRNAAAAIDGLDGKSWNLPLPPLTRSSLEP